MGRTGVGLAKRDSRWRVDRGRAGEADWERSKDVLISTTGRRLVRNLGGGRPILGQVDSLAWLAEELGKCVCGGGGGCPGHLPPAKFLRKRKRETGFPAF